MKRNQQRQKVKAKVIERENRVDEVRINKEKESERHISDLSIKVLFFSLSRLLVQSKYLYYLIIFFLHLKIEKLSKNLIRNCY